jgi:hypothetical protein
MRKDHHFIDLVRTLACTVRPPPIRPTQVRGTHRPSAGQGPQRARYRSLRTFPVTNTRPYYTIAVTPPGRGVGSMRYPKDVEMPNKINRLLRRRQARKNSFRLRRITLWSGLGHFRADRGHRITLRVASPEKADPSPVYGGVYAFLSVLRIVRRCVVRYRKIKKSKARKAKSRRWHSFLIPSCVCSLLSINVSGEDFRSKQSKERGLPGLSLSRIAMPSVPCSRTTPHAKIHVHRGQGLDQGHPHPGLKELVCSRTFCGDLLPVGQRRRS